MATNTSAVKRFASGPLHGTALALYFLLLPYVVISKWRLTSHQADGTLVRVLLLALGLFWLAFLFQLANNVVRLRRGHRLEGGGSVWLAGLLVATISFLVPSAMTAAAAASPAQRSAATAQTALPVFERAHSISRESPEGANANDLDRHGHPLPWGSSPLSSLPIALFAKRRSDTLRANSEELSEDEMDDTVALLQGANPLLLAQFSHLVAEKNDGVLRLTSDFYYGAVSQSTDPLAVCVVNDGDDGVLLSFAREGGRLQVPDTWSQEEIVKSVVALHEGGRLQVASTEYELLRLLATRALRSTLVLYLGPPSDIDDALRACAITVEPVSIVEEAENVVAGTRFSTTGRAADDPADQSVGPPRDARVLLLRADPSVIGLHEAFTATLRRRCVEMAAYLALHRHEPVTGDRLRTRVLSHADVDASLRTLANTASAVRRSLGTDIEGPRLHPVTSSGLYVTHALTSDVEVFHALIARARQLPLIQGAPLLHQALNLVHGEPLASALRGFEWFLVEGHWARLQRDGEWAALALHQCALDDDDVELAFWALERGRLLDPYNDALAEAMTRVPRLRQFGGNRTGGAQHDPISPRSAVVTSGTLGRFS